MTKEVARAHAKRARRVLAETTREVRKWERGLATWRKKLARATAALAKADERAKALSARKAKPKGKAAPAAKRGYPRDRLLSELRRLQAKDALVSVPELRRAVGISKEAFDRLALALQRERVVGLHMHDHPFGLSEQKRDELVRDPKGTHYIGIHLMRGAERASDRKERQAVGVKTLVFDAVKRSPGGTGRHYLADVRERLLGVPREEQDHALRELQDEGKIVLMRNDNSAEVKARDEHAALYIAGHPRHLVYLT